jgi:uncharacterized protein (TIGR00290 family)
VKVLVSWSSGKDSAWMLHVLNTQQPGAAAGLLTSMNEVADRVAMHAVRADVLRAQAAATGLPLYTVPLPSPCPNDVYEERMAAMVRRAASEGFTHVAFGDLFLEDVRRYREDRMAGTGLTPVFPLWGRPTASLSRDMLAGGLDAVITCVDPRQVPRTFAGRRYDAQLVADLPAGADPCGERGEFHTCVVAGPMFSRRLEVTVGDIVDRDGFVFADVMLDPRTGEPAAQAANSTCTR